MVNKCMQLFVILLSLSLLGVVGLSFSFAKLKPPNDDDEPQPSRLTGYPTWHGKVKDFDPNRDDAMGFLSFTLMVLAGIIGLKTVRNPPTKPKLITYFYTVSDDSDRVPTGVPTLGFNTMLVVYNWFTSLTVLASLVFDVGKVFSIIGILHNTSEVIILILLGNGGRIRNSSFFAWILIYIWSVVAICIFVDFPADAAFFKFQGLCIDFALFIEYTRIFITTKEHIRDAGRDTLPLNTDDDDNNDDNDTHRFSPIWPATIDHPNHIWLLIVASAFHLVGNVTITWFNNLAKPSLLFGLTYAITFPLYVYFAYLDTNAPSVLPQKRIYLPSTPTWKVIVISVFSITLSALTLRIAVSL